jgi:hypothetical protein
LGVGVERKSVKEEDGRLGTGIYCDGVGLTARVVNRPVFGGNH